LHNVVYNIYDFFDYFMYCEKYGWIGYIRTFMNIIYSVLIELICVYKFNKCRETKYEYFNELIIEFIFIR